MDHRGVTAILGGSLFVELIRKEARLGPNQEVRLQSINVEIDKYYETHTVSSQLKNIRVENLTLDGKFSSWAVLHGPIVKAANTRHTAPILYELA